jgi:signal transduction histidine kinase
MADAQFATEVLVRNLMRAGDLVRSFKQVAVDRASSQRRQFNLQDIVSEIVITLSPVISRSGCEVQMNIASGLELDSYPGPLGQVLDNLINNAMAHAFVNGQRGLIEVHARDLNADEVQIEVRDNGVGIPADNLKRVFDPFFTTRLGQGGSGLGLHIVHNIVTEVLGGHVNVSSQPGAGTVFTLRLPLRAPVSVTSA